MSDNYERGKNMPSLNSPNGSSDIEENRIRVRTNLQQYLNQENPAEELAVPSTSGQSEPQQRKQFNTIRVIPLSSISEPQTQDPPSKKSKSCARKPRRKRQQHKPTFTSAPILPPGFINPSNPYGLGHVAEDASEIFQNALSNFDHNSGNLPPFESFSDLLGIPAHANPPRPLHTDNYGPYPQLDLSLNGPQYVEPSTSGFGNYQQFQPDTPTSFERPPGNHKRAISHPRMLNIPRTHTATNSIMCRIPLQSIAGFKNYKPSPYTQAFNFETASGIRKPPPSYEYATSLANAHMRCPTPSSQFRPSVPVSFPPEIPELPANLRAELQPRYSRSSTSQVVSAPYTSRRDHEQFYPNLGYSQPANYGHEQRQPESMQGSYALPTLSQPQPCMTPGQYGFRENNNQHVYPNLLSSTYVDLRKEPPLLPPPPPVQILPPLSGLSLPLSPLPLLPILPPSPIPQPPQFIPPEFVLPQLAQPQPGPSQLVPLPSTSELGPTEHQPLQFILSQREPQFEPPTRAPQFALTEAESQFQPHVLAPSELTLTQLEEKFGLSKDTLLEYTLSQPEPVQSTPIPFASSEPGAARTPSPQSTPPRPESPISVSSEWTSPSEPASPQPGPSEPVQRTSSLLAPLPFLTARVHPDFLQQFLNCISILRNLELWIDPPPFTNGISFTTMRLICNHYGVVFPSTPCFRCCIEIYKVACARCRFCIEFVRAVVLEVNRAQDAVEGTLQWTGTHYRVLNGELINNLATVLSHRMVLFPNTYTTHGAKPEPWLSALQAYLLNFLWTQDESSHNRMDHASFLREVLSAHVGFLSLFDRLILNIFGCDMPIPSQLNIECKRYSAVLDQFQDYSYQHQLRSTQAYCIRNILQLYNSRNRSARVIVGEPVEGSQEQQQEQGENGNQQSEDSDSLS